MENRIGYRERARRLLIEADQAQDSQARGRLVAQAAHLHSLALWLEMWSEQSAAADRAAGALPR